MTMTLIETKTLGTAQAAIEFTSIPGTYTDLLALVSPKSTSTDLRNFFMNVNGASTNMSIRYFFGNGSSPGVGTSPVNVFGLIPGSTFAGASRAGVFGSGAIYIPNYASTTTAKSISGEVVGEGNQTESYLFLTAALYNSNTAITSLTFFADGNLEVGSMVSLYGILKGSSNGVVVS